MKNLYILASVVCVLFFAEPSEVTAQRKKAVLPGETIVGPYLRSRVTAESGGVLSVGMFRRVNGYDDGKDSGVYVVEWEADISFDRDSYKVGPSFEFMGCWQTFRVLPAEPPPDYDCTNGSFRYQPPTLIHKGTIFQLSGKAWLRKTEKGWRLETFSVMRARESPVNATKPPPETKPKSSPKPLATPSSLMP